MGFESEALLLMLARDHQHYHNNQSGHGCECYDSVVKSVMMSLGYKCNPMASRERVPVNFQSNGAAWPQVGVKAVALFDERIGGSDLLSGLAIWPSQSAFRVVTSLPHKIYRELERRQFGLIFVIKVMLFFSVFSFLHLPPTWRTLC